MGTVTVDALETTVHKTHLWLKELMSLGHYLEENQAWSALRSVLHALRDHLTIDEAAHLSAQLPMLVRGCYYEGWKPSAVPDKHRTREAFYEAVRTNLGNASMDPMQAIDAVLQLLDHHVSPGELRTIKSMLPQELRELWPL